MKTYVVESFDKLGDKTLEELKEIKDKCQLVIPITSFIDDFEVKTVATAIFFNKPVIVKFRDWNQGRSYLDAADEVIYFVKTMTRLKLLLNATETKQITDWVIFYDVIDGQEKEQYKEAVENAGFTFTLNEDVAGMLNKQYHKLFEIEKMIKEAGGEK